MKTTSLLALCLATLAFTACGGEDDSEPAASAALAPKVAGSAELGGAPVAAAVDSDGVWMADNAGSQVIHLDASSRKPVGAPIPVRGGPLSIAAGDGAVWVASGDGTITRIGSSGEDVTQAPETVLQPGGIAVAEGSVWVTSSPEGRLYRLDAESGEVTDTYEIGEFPADVAVTDGSAWVANTNDGTVSQVEIESGEVSDPVEVAAEQVLALAADEDGVWVAGSDDERVESIDISRIDPSSGEVGDDAASLETGIPIRLAVGEGGVWATVVGPLSATASKKPGSVALIDPATGEASGEPVEVGSRPSGIATGEGSVWVANAGDGTVSQIDPGG